MATIVAGPSLGLVAGVPAAGLVLARLAASADTIRSRPSGLELGVGRADLLVARGRAVVLVGRVAVAAAAARLGVPGLDGARRLDFPQLDDELVERPGLVDLTLDLRVAELLGQLGHELGSVPPCQRTEDVVHVAIERLDDDVSGSGQNHSFSRVAAL